MLTRLYWSCIQRKGYTEYIQSIGYIQTMCYIQTIVTYLTSTGQPSQAVTGTRNLSSIIINYANQSKNLTHNGYIFTVMHIMYCHSHTITV